MGYDNGYRAKGRASLPPKPHSWRIPNDLERVVARLNRAFLSHMTDEAGIEELGLRFRREFSEWREEYGSEVQDRAILIYLLRAYRQVYR